MTYMNIFYLSCKPFKLCNMEFSENETCVFQSTCSIIVIMRSQVQSMIKVGLCTPTHGEVQIIYYTTLLTPDAPYYLDER